MGEVTFQTVSVSHRWDHADIYWLDNGTVGIRSTYDVDGWHYFQVSGSIPAFLLRVESDYLARKILGSQATAFSLSASIALVREYAEGDDEWRGPESRASFLADLDSVTDKAELLAVLNEHQWEDAYEYLIRDIVPQWRHFWERLWVPHVRPALQEVVDG